MGISIHAYSMGSQVNRPWLVKAKNASMYMVMGEMYLKALTVIQQNNLFFKDTIIIILVKEKGRYN
jgi:hypothetical protein